MDDKFTVRYLYLHILRVSAVLLLICTLATQSYATTGDEKERKAKDNPETVKKANLGLKMTKTSDESFKNTPVVNKELPIKTSQQHHILINDSPSFNGEDQNAVLSFNIIQYIFERFKFSEEAY